MNLKKEKKKGKVISFKYILYDFVKITGVLPVALFFRTKKYYFDKDTKKKIKAIKGRRILSMNHQSFLDPIVGQFLFFFRRTYMIAMQDLFNTKLRAWFFPKVLCIKVDTSSNFDLNTIDTFEKANEALQNEKSLAIFPEGHVFRNNQLNSFKMGTALMAIRAKAPIIPIYFIKRKSYWNRQRVVFGNPIDVAKIAKENKGKEAIKKITEALFDATAILKEHYETNILNKKKKK